MKRHIKKLLLLVVLVGIFFIVGAPVGKNEFGMNFKDAGSSVSVFVVKLLDVQIIGSESQMDVSDSKNLKTDNNDELAITEISATTLVLKRIITDRNATVFADWREKIEDGDLSTTYMDTTLRYLDTLGKPYQWRITDA